MTHPATYLIFIGGAADKESFLWGNVNLPFTNAWPHHLVGDLGDNFYTQLKKVIIDEKDLLPSLEPDCKIDYLSYTEVFFEEIKSYDPTKNQLPQLNDDKLALLTGNIGENTKVYIVGHSLGAWNAAHLSYLLTKQGAHIEYLVTLDPVGTGNHEVQLFSPLMKKAQIYTHDPIPVAKYWFNIQARHLAVSEKQTSGLLEDWVAWAGGQWLIEREYPTVEKQVCEVTNFSHKEVPEMFNYPTKFGYSAYDAMQDSIVKTIKQLKRKHYNPVYWLKKLVD